jgi:isopentenyldiphosphate isomerase
MGIQVELVDIVNEKDEIIGQDLRTNKIKKGFIFRVAAAFLVDSNGKLIITKRSKQKDIDPGLYDLAAVGGVLAGESYKQAIERELQEELSISCELKMLDKFYWEIRRKEGFFKTFCAVFLGKTDQVPKLNDEVSEFKKIRLAEIKKEIKDHPEEFCPGFINDFNHVEKKLLTEIK